VGTKGFNQGRVIEGFSLILKGLWRQFFTDFWNYWLEKKALYLTTRFGGIN